MSNPRTVWHGWSHWLHISFARLRLTLSMLLPVLWDSTCTNHGFLQHALGGHCKLWLQCASTLVAATRISEALGTQTVASAAEYPEALALRYAEQTRCLFPAHSGVGASISMHSAPLLSRLKAPSEPPVSVQDDTGIFSVPNWSIPPQDATDVFGSLRPQLLDFLLQNKHPLRLRYPYKSQSPDSLFQASEITSLRGIFEHWLSTQAKPMQVSWNIAEGQPYCLEALQLVSAICADRDTTLFPCLLSGVPTGFDADIPLSNVPQGEAGPVTLRRRGA